MGCREGGVERRIEQRQPFRELDLASRWAAMCLFVAERHQVVQIGSEAAAASSCSCRIGQPTERDAPAGAFCCHLPRDGDPVAEGHAAASEGGTP